MKTYRTFQVLFVSRFSKTLQGYKDASPLYKYTHKKNKAYSLAVGSEIDCFTFTTLSLAQNSQGLQPRSNIR